jgi:hypothetical protein
MKIIGYKIDLGAIDDIMALDKNFDSLYQNQVVHISQALKATQAVIDNAQQIVQLIGKYEGAAKELGDKGLIANLGFRKKQAESRIKTATSELAKLKAFK